MANNDLKKVTGQFKGLMLEKTLANGNEMYKVKFEVQGKLWSFNTFMPWTKKDGNIKAGVQPPNLEMGQYYDISFTEYFAEGREHPSKTVICFFENTNPEASMILPEAPTIDVAKEEAAAADNSLTKDAVESVAELYFQQVSPQEANLRHFIGTVLKSLDPDSIKTIEAVWNARIDKKWNVKYEDDIDIK